MPLEHHSRTPELVFLHIPRTAGTSQRRSFRRYYDRGSTFWIGGDCSADLRRYPRALVGDCPLVGGHKPLSFYPRYFDPLFCAVLRNPVERAISLFVYYTQPQLALTEGDFRARQGMLERLRKKGMDPESMLGSVRSCRAFRREISNMQCAYISRFRRDYKGALRSLASHDFILGTFSEYERFHQRLGALLDWPEAQPGSLNRSKNDYASAWLGDAELVALLQELNQEDEKLLHFVTQEHAGLYVNLRDPAARQRRLERLPLKPWLGRNAKCSWQEAASRLWPARKGARLSWPLDKILVAEASELMYMAIPGPANASACRLMLACSSVPHQEQALQLGLARVLARFETGLMLGDRDCARVRSLLAADGFYKFAIVYEPVARLVDIYVDKFVLNRSDLAGRPGLEGLVAAAQAGATADVEQGISFREFVSAILRQQPQRQHWLWAPQYLYLEGLAGCDKLYRQDQLQLLHSDLTRLKAVSVAVPQTLAPPAAAVVAGEGSVTDGQYADCHPPQLSKDPSDWRDHLVDRELCERILEYYDRDCALYQRTAENEIKTR